MMDGGTLDHDDEHDRGHHRDEPFPRYRHVADTLRLEIQLGVYEPGEPLPSTRALCEGYGVARDVVRDALQVLYVEGLITSTFDGGARVREPVPRRLLTIGRNDRVLARMPSMPEREQLDMQVGVPLLEVHRADGAREAYPADTIVIVADPS